MLALLPLTPKLFFLGYDGDVYSVPNERGVVEIKSARDVIARNRHQFLQCVANGYVHDAIHEETLIKHYSEIEAVRRLPCRILLHRGPVDFAHLNQINGVERPA